MSVDCIVGCPWNAEWLAPWIHVLSSMPRAGDDGLFFRVDANATPIYKDAGHLRAEYVRKHTTYMDPAMTTPAPAR